MTALWLGRCGGEVCLVINIIPRIRQNTWRWAQWTTSRVRVRKEEVIRESAGRATKNSARQVRVKDAQDSSQSGRSSLFRSSKEERNDGVDALVDVAEDRGDVEVWSAELSNRHADWIFGVDVDETLGKGFDGAVLG
jgi:hypothetical protein